MSSDIKKPRDYSFRNILLLIVIVIGIFYWFENYPDHAKQTMFRTYNATVAHLNNLLDTNLKSYVPTPSVVEQAQESEEFIITIPQEEIIVSGDVTTGITTGDISTGTIDQTTPSTGSIISDVEQADDSNVTTEGNPGTSGGIVSISVGLQTINIEGSVNEDIVINGNGYRITVQ